PDIGAASNAFLVGHELGHNFGARHTHCANAANGNGDTGVGTIDQCFNGDSGCYTGTPSCPTSGPGAPKGTLMSYCHRGGANGANCMSNVLQFHPTHVSQLRANIAATPLTCLRLDGIFATGFQ
ncbi:MAG: M12 family metallo-peptidase, partial [Dokdonella sp.]